MQFSAKLRTSSIALWAVITVTSVPLLGPMLSARAVAATPVVDTDSDLIATSKIHDLTATLQINDDLTNFDELKKIGGSFATTYRVAKTMQVSYEYPNKARFEGHSFLGPLALVYNGDMKEYHTPIKSGVQNVANQPGQKQSLLDLGIFAKDFLATDYKATYQRTEKGLLVYRLSLRNTNNNSHEFVWVNPKTAITERRQSYNGDNKFIKELHYVNVKQIQPGIYVPQRIEIFNQFGKLGAVQDVTGIKVNAGVDEGLFTIS